MAHAAPAAGRHQGTMRHIDTGAWLRPVLFGLVYGVYAAFMKRQMGPVDAGNVFYGILCGVLFAGMLFLLSRVGPSLPRELRAAAYGAFAGIAMGYLYSLADESILRSVGIALAVAVPIGIGAFYRYYQREP
ncbi:hypothetical protein LG634_01040 [Streptomyces bambusae]|uniref:hypothetical protein n=1 Tax=Streptomyces bambusae TaxID=1550616 RepID=UPI001CFF487E|nr:hypothetical protein [Streptomyces bambusae]MCB5163439.1 hypothetical protein [Streptomyces bambusae]